MSARGYNKADEGFNVFAALMALGGPDPDKRHWHRCLKCAHIWDHTQAEVYATDESETAFDKAHACPNCGQGNCCTKFTSAEHAKTAPLRYAERNRSE